MGVLISDRDLLIRHVSGAALRQLGLGTHNPAGQPVGELVGRFGADAEDFERRVKATDASTGFACELSAPGRPNLVCTTSTLIEADGAISGYITLIDNPGEQRADDVRYRDLVNHMADWVWEVDMNGRFTFVSERIRDVLGYDPAWVIGRTPMDLMGREEGERWLRDFRATAPTPHDITDLAYAHRHQDGHDVTLAISGTAILDADGTQRGYRGVSRDITEARAALDSLRQSKAQLQAIFDNASVGIMLLTGYRKLARGNQKLADILGYDSPEQMRGISMLELHLDRERFEEFGAAHYETLRQQEQLHVEYQLRRRDGSPVWCMVSGKAVDPSTPADLSQGVIWIVDDIEQRKAEELALRRTLRTLDEERHLFAAGPTMVFRWLPEAGWPVEYCSPNVERELGVSADEFVAGKAAFADFVHPEDLHRIAAEVEGFLLAGRTDFEQEYRLRGAQGDWRHVYDYTRVLRDDNGQVRALHGYLVDITERRIRQTELRTLLDAIPDLIFFKDKDGRYVECNAAFTQFIGRPRDAIVGFTDHDFFSSEEAEFFRGQDAAMLASGAPRRNEEWVTYPDGHRYLLDTLKMPYGPDGQEADGVLGISRDITLQHRQAIELQQAQELAGIGSGYQDLRTGEVHWSPMLYRILDLDPATTTPGIDALLSRVVPSERARVAAALESVTSTDGALVETEYPIVRRDGSRRQIFSRRERILDDVGRPVRIDGIVQDITGRHLADMALRESEERYRSMFESAGQGMLILAADGKITSANQTACEMLGYPEPGAMLSALPQTLSPPTQPDGQSSFEKGSRLIETAFASGFVRFEWDHRHLDGHIVPIEVSLSRISLGGERALLCTWFDLRDKRRAAELQSRASAVFENTAEGIMITDTQSRILSVNPAFTEITGYTEDEVRWRRPNFLQSGRQDPAFYESMWRQLTETGNWRGEIWNRRRNGEEYPEWLSISTIRGDQGEARNYIGVFSDMSESHHFAQRIEQLSHFDVLTGLPNPALLRARLSQTLDSATVAGNKVAAILLSIDGFERLISSMGREAADRVLVRVADKLRGAIPADATLGRLNNDVFALTVEVEAVTNAVTHIAHDLQDRLREGIETDELGHISIISQIGIALYPDDTRDAGALLSYAESALHTARASGPSALAYYHPAMTEAATSRLQTEQALREALENAAYELHFQPKISLTDGRVVGAEALIRWHRDGELVPPGEFMPIVESSDLVLPIGRWVLRAAARAVLDWQAAGLNPPPVSVNISGAMIANGSLADEIGAVLAETGIAPRQLEIEVLENVLLDDPDRATRQLNAVHALGVAIALDDFGTGYSSLAYLQRLPFDIIKIDRAFVADLEHSATNQAVVRATLSMARNLSRAVVAEGIETAMQAQQLMRLGCETIQGYLTGRPMPATEFTALLGDQHEAALRDMVTSLTKPKALIVEDEPIQRELLEARLEAANWKVIAVESAEDALVFLAREPIDLLLADYMLPGMDGLELLDRCRHTHPETVRVMLSGTDSREVMQQAINQGGVFRYLIKPVDDDTLMKMLGDVRRLTQRLWHGGMDNSLLNPD
ncbi:MAG: PAS domain S-box protein [Chromatiales bacterium]|nr:PAS domain S-box protein [Chromatiales bacterium]